MKKVYSERTPVTEPEPSATQAGTRGPNSDTGSPSPKSRTPDPLCLEFLLRCLSVSREPLAVSREPTPDWNEVVGIANNHGITPLLYTRLKQNDAQAYVPADVWERLRRAYSASAVRSTCFQRDLRPVLRCLRSSGIKVIVLKGAYLTEAVYDDAALRPMCDADLMVPRAELPRARAVLLGMGGIQRQFEDIESCRVEGLHLPQVVIRDLTIEIHWTIAFPIGPVRVDAAGLWDRARRASVAGVEVLALSPEDLLLHLCLHACYQHHLEVGLISFYDIAETVHRFRGDMDWAQVVHSASEWRAARHVALALQLARSLLRVDVPDHVLEQLVPGGIDQRILEMARESVFAWMFRAACVSRPVRDLWGAKSIGDKARLLRERLFPSRDEMAAMYPASRDSKHFYFYYALRLRDIMRIHGRYVPLMVRSRDIRQSASKMVSVADWLKSG